jgi:hypothetical protein
MKQGDHMKQVINGKIYDTSKAIQIGKYQHSYPSDLNYCIESLYKTKRGNFFLCGEGGPMSKYVKFTSCNSCTGDSKIIPLSKAEALAWAEKADALFFEIEKIFEDLVEEA